MNPIGPSPARLEAPRRRKVLLDAAERLIARQGFRRTTTASLARAAGVSEPILYRHFRNKEDLFHALLREISGRTMRGLEEALRGAAGPREKLARLALSFPAVGRKLARTYRVMLAGIGECDRAGTRGILRAHFESYAAFLSDILRDLGACRRGELDPERTAWHLIHLAVGYALLDPVALPACRGGAYVAHAAGFLARALGEAGEGAGGRRRERERRDSPPQANGDIGSRRHRA
jgi:AcrR family transcriptional regulator